MAKRLPRQGYEFHSSPLYKLRSRKRLAKLLRVSRDTLNLFSQGKASYVRRWKHKQEEKWLKYEPTGPGSEDYRPIDIPHPTLKAMQGRIADLLSRIAAPEFLFSPVKGRSYVENGAYHVGANAFWLLDVANYFPSCTANNVAHFFNSRLQCSPDVVAVLVRLACLEEALPQGSPCSPILAYYCNQHVWLEVNDMARSHGCKMSLYADDITISGPMIPKELIWRIKKLLVSNRLQLKKKKELSTIGRPADITGVIVTNKGTKLPNRQHRRLVELRAELATCKDPVAATKIQRQIAGRIAQRNQVEGTKPAG